MDRIKSIQAKIDRGRYVDDADAHEDIEYLLAENKRLRDRTATYRIALEEIAGYISDDAVFMRETAQEVLSNESLREE